MKVNYRSSDLTQIRQLMGICPQYNVLFDKMSVKDHLYFFCKLKGAEFDSLDLCMIMMITNDLL